MDNNRQCKSEIVDSKIEEPEAVIKKDHQL